MNFEPIISKLVELLTSGDDRSLSEILDEIVPGLSSTQRRKLEKLWLDVGSDLLAAAGSPKPTVNVLETRKPIL